MRQLNLKIKNKIILGSANFSSKYGIGNNVNLSLPKIKKIFLEFNKKKLNFIDTSKGYNNSESIIGKFNQKKNWKIITKIPKIKLRKKSSIEKFVNDQIYDSLIKLNSKKLYGLLLHDENQLLSSNANYIYNILLELKKKKVINKIGVSFYTKTKLLKTISRFNIDIVQIPINYMNKSFENTEILKYIKNKNIEIHARSVFLQGLLLKKKIDDKRFKNFIKFLNIWHNQNKLSRLETSLNYINNNEYIDKFLVGVDNHHQINEILTVKQKKIYKYPSYNNNFIKDPRKWS